MTKTTNKKKCCQAAEAEPNKAKRILKKIYQGVVVGGRRQDLYGRADEAEVLGQVNLLCLSVEAE